MTRPVSVEENRDRWAGLLAGLMVMFVMGLIVACAWLWRLASKGWMG